MKMATPIVIEQTDGFKINDLYLKKSDGWTFNQAEQVRDAVVAAHEQGWADAFEAATDALGTAFLG